MAKKAILTGFIASLLFVSLIAYSLPALAQNEHATTPDLPENARFQAMPFKEIVVEKNGNIVVLKPLITTTNNPDQYLAGPEFDGVPVLLLPRTDIQEGYVAVCTGTLLPTGYHILTAAHCVTDEDGNLTLKSSAGAQARFGNDIDDDSNKFFIDVANTQIHSGWVGNFWTGNDLAVLVLYADASNDFTTYDLFKGDQQDDLVDTHITIHKVGFGNTGLLSNGETDNSLGIKRDGTNRLDDSGDAFKANFGIPGIPGGHLMFDSDNGNPDNDAFGDLFGGTYVDFAGGPDEVMSAGGDSGGPAFYFNPLTGLYEIIGVTSGGVVYGGSRGTDTADCHKNIIPGGINSPDSSCGEFGLDVSPLIPENKAFVEFAQTVFTDADNDPPTADAGPDQTTGINEGDLVSLSGSGSDPEGQPITYSWTQAGTDTVPVSLTGADTLTPSFTAPESTANYNINLTLTVSDGTNNAQDSVLITVSADNDPSPVEFTITSWSTNPDSVENTLVRPNPYTLYIDGFGFGINPEVSITGGSGPAPKVTIASSSDTQITADLVLKNGGPPRCIDWTLTVINDIGDIAISTTPMRICP